MELVANAQPTSSSASRKRGPKPRPATERLVGKVDVRSADECWPFTGFLNALGYGQMTENRTSVGAHRVAWRAAFGPIPEGMCVCHACDNPPCCNPAHLFLGTHADNMADAASKKRMWREPGRNEDNKHHKLSNGQVREIRVRYAAGGISQRGLGREYGVTQAQIWHIVHDRQRTGV